MLWPVALREVLIFNAICFIAFLLAPTSKDTSNEWGKLQISSVSFHQKFYFFRNYVSSLLQPMELQFKLPNKIFIKDLPYYTYAYY